MSEMTENERLISFMAFAMQTAHLALENSKRDEPAEAALSSLTIALNMEAEHWQRNIRRKHLARS